MFSSSQNPDELDALINRSGGRLWRARRTEEGYQKALSTGHQALDSALSGAGWPLGRVTELLLVEPAHGELRLLLPAMQTLGEQQRWVSWINPPAIPYAPALAQTGLDLQRNLWLPGLAPESAWWAMEQLARHRRGGLVIAWLEPLHAHAIRRLQLAVEAGGGMAVLCRNVSARNQASAATLRLLLRPQKHGLARGQGFEIEIIKSSNSLRRQVITLV